MSDAKRYHVRKYGLSLSLTYFPKGRPMPGLEVQFECPGLTLGGYIYG